MIQRRAIGTSNTSDTAFKPQHGLRLVRVVIIQCVSARSTFAMTVIGIGMLIGLLSFLGGCSRSRTTAQTKSNTASAVSRIDVSRVANARVEDPEKLCERITEIKMFPWHSVERDQDPIFDEIMRAGYQVVPCLIDKVTDTTPMPNFINDDVSKPDKTVVGDLAVRLLQDITNVDLESMIPDRFRHPESIGMGSYYEYMEKPAHRKDLQEKLLDWYHRMEPTNSSTGISRATKIGELRQVRMSVNKEDIGRLEEKDGRCVLVMSEWSGRPHGGTLHLDLTPPCEFVRNETGGAQTFAYMEDNKLDEFWVEMVVGGPIDPSRSDPYMKTGCGTQIQAIKLTSTGSPNDVQKKSVGTGITVCPSEGVKETIYGLLAKRVGY